MKSKKTKERYVAFLRGINVGGHHKVPMADLRKEMERLNCENVVTLLNTGNIIFEAKSDEIRNLEKMISAHLEKVFGFPIPVIIRTSEAILKMLTNDPFQVIPVITKDIRLYVSLLRKAPTAALQLPWTSENQAFQIINISANTIFSVLDLSVTKTPKGMENLERYFGKDITTRNWNTIKRVGKKLEAS